MSSQTETREARNAGSALDVDKVRKEYPAFDREVGGRPAVYLDGAGGSQTPHSVMVAMTEYMTRSNANTDGAFVTSEETDALIQAAREAAADLLGVTSDEVVFAGSTTTLNFLLAHAVARTLKPGDEILVTELDHDANVSPWLMIAADHNLEVKTVPLQPEDGTLDLEALEAMVSPRTRVVACTGASNALGSITNMSRVAAIARGVDALLWVDAVHLAPHRRIVNALGADVLLTSAYKYFGPHLAVAAVRHPYVASWPADRARPASITPPGHRFETGTLSHEAIAGFVAAVEYLESLGDGHDRPTRLNDAYQRIEAYEDELTRYTLKRLESVPGLTLYGITDPARSTERTPTFCFRLDGWSPRHLSEELGRRGIFTWDGNYYALGAMEALGLEESGGAVRASYLHYTSLAEAELLCDELENLARRTSS